VAVDEHVTRLRPSPQLLHASPHALRQADHPRFLGLLAVL
jgi:hypothetical protein